MCARRLIEVAYSSLSYHTITFCDVHLSKAELDVWLDRTRQRG